MVVWIDPYRFASGAASFPYLNLSSSPTWTENHYYVSNVASEENAGDPAYDATPYVQKSWRRDSTYANWTAPLTDTITGNHEFALEFYASQSGAPSSSSNGWLLIGLASTDDWFIGLAVTMNSAAGADATNAAIRAWVIPDITPGASSGYTNDAVSSIDTTELDWLDTRTLRLKVNGTALQVLDESDNVVVSATASTDLSAKTWDRFGFLGIRGTTGFSDNTKATAFRVFSAAQTA